MRHVRTLRIAVLLACLPLASAAAADTIYKYRRADGQVLYSSRPVSGLELIETFDYRFPAPAAASDSAMRSAAAKSDAEGEARVTKYLAALEAAWRQVQDAGNTLAVSEARLRAAVEPQAGDRDAVASAPASFAPPPSPPEVGGPTSPPPSVGGVPAVAPPAIGGSMSGRRGRASTDYLSRIDAMEAEVRSARERLDVALRDYNRLR